MTDLQLSVLLEHIESRLKAAIDAAEYQMPDDIVRLPQEHYIGKGIRNPFSRDSSDYEIRNDGDIAAFVELMALRKDLREQIDNFKGEHSID